MESKLLGGHLSQIYAQTRKVPHSGILASIRYSDLSPYCTGIVIGLKQVLSAADCLIPFKDLPNYGGLLVATFTKVTNILLIDVPTYTPDIDFNDLGLITVMS